VYDVFLNSITNGEHNQLLLSIDDIGNY
jgi:hypothetical protein